MLDFERMAKLAGFCKGPLSNKPSERIWQENREFPDALELYTSMVIEQCIGKILSEIENQNKQNITTNMIGLNQAIFSLRDLNEEVLKAVDFDARVVYDTDIKQRN